MGYGLTITAGGSELSLLTLAKEQHIRVNSGSDEDDIIQGYLTTARHAFEKNTNRVCASTTFRLDLYKFPSDPLYLPVAPVVSVSSFTYYDGSTWQNYTDYQLDVARNRLWIGSSLPSPDPLTKPNVKITFVAGYTTLPKDIQTAILLYASHLYFNREATTGESLNETPLGFENLCATYRYEYLADMWGE